MAAGGEAPADMAQQVFVTNRLRLLENLDVNPILDDLRQAGILNLDDQERILSGVTTKDKIRSLIDKLHRMRHHPTAVTEFMDSLKRHQPWLHDQVMDSSPSETSLQQRLKDCYLRKKALMMKHPWATERSSRLPPGLYTNLKLIDHEDSYPNRASFNEYSAFQDFCRDSLPEVSLKELFERGAAGKRILIEGDSGIGKTTMCYKLAHDFAQADLEENQKYFVHDLLFVFVIEVRNLRGTLKETIQRLLSLNDSDMNQVWRIIQLHPARCLFILDGLDEKSRNIPQDVRDLIEGNLFGESLVLATCRTNKANDFSEFFDKIVINVGFFPDQAFEYVQKYFSLAQLSGVDINQVREFLEEQTEVLGDLLRTPLNCLLLCLWLEEWMTTRTRNQPFSQGKHLTTTNFYEMVIRSFLRRYCKKENIPLNRGGIPADLKEKVVKLYKLALFGVLKEKFKFTKEDLENHQISEDDDILNLGFLSREYSVSALNDEDDIGYSFPHRSIQEFFAAKAIDHIPDSPKLHLLAYFAHNWKTHENICLFLGGLLNDAVLLKWMLCCTIQNISITEHRLSDVVRLAISTASRRPEVGDTLARAHETGCCDIPWSVSQGRKHQNHKAFMQGVIEKSEELLNNLESISSSSDGWTENALMLSQIQSCVNKYQPAVWIWHRSETSKLDKILCHCLRRLYEVCPEEKPALLKELIGYLADLSHGIGPPWDAINDASLEVRPVIVRLWSHQKCKSSVISMKEFCVPCQVMGNVWSMLFRTSSLCLQKLELVFSNMPQLVDVLDHLGPQLMNVERLVLNSDSEISLNHGEEDTRKTREIERRGIVREKMSEMTQLKSLLISSRHLSSCIGFISQEATFDSVMIVSLHWPQRAMEELIHEAIRCSTKKLVLYQRNVHNSDCSAQIIQTLEDSAPRANQTLKDIQLQGFRFSVGEKARIDRLKNFFRTKKINLKFSECYLVAKSVDSVEDLENLLSVGTSRDDLIVHQVLQVSEAVFADVDGCMDMFSRCKKLDWRQLGINHLDVVTRLLQAGLTSTSTPLPKIEVDLVGKQGFQKFVAPALHRLKAEKVELLLSFDDSVDHRKHCNYIVNMWGGKVGWDHAERKAYASFTRDPVDDDPRLMRDCFPELG